MATFSFWDATGFKTVVSVCAIVGEDRLRDGRYWAWFGSGSAILLPGCTEPVHTVRQG